MYMFHLNLRHPVSCIHVYLFILPVIPVLPVSVSAGTGRQLLQPQTRPRSTRSLREVSPSALKQQHHGASYTQGEMTSQNLWSGYDRHFVGITWHNAWS